MQSQLMEVWLTGTRYAPLPAHIALSENIIPETDVEIEQLQFLQDFQSKVWCSYRRGFPNIPTTKLTSDSGWGCMLRSGQMMLAGAFLRHFLGPEWRLATTRDNPEIMRKYKTILSWFADRNGQASPYSLANMAHRGIKFDTPIGQWHGPTTTAQILKILVSQHAPEGFKVYLSQDATVYRNDVRKLCEQSPGGEWSSVLILLPARLGVELNTKYLPFLRETFKFPQSLGFAGGKIGMSLTSVLTLGKLRTQRAVRSMYFLGIDDQSGLYFLDPHKTQDSLHFDHIDSVSPEDLSSYHYHLEPKRTTLDQIDPSLLLGFYCRDQKDFEDFVERTEQLAKQCSPPIFVIGKKKPVYKEDANILTEDTKNSAKWTEAGSSDNLHPYKQGHDSSLTGLGNPRPQNVRMDMADLCIFHSANGGVLGVIILTQGYLIFEPLRQDPLVRKNGADKYRWWIRVPFLERCRIMEDSADIESRNSDDFIVLHSQTESDTQPEANAASFLDDSNINRRMSTEGTISEGSKQPHTHASGDAAEDEEFSAPRGSKSNSVVSGIVHAVDVKNLLVNEFKSAVNFCHIAAVKTKRPLSQPIPEVLRMLTSLEWLFQHGLKERSSMTNLSNQFFEMAKGKMPASHPLLTFWPVLEKILPHEIADLLRKPPFDESELERCRAFFRMALSEGTLHSYFTTFLSDQKLLQQFYGPTAVFADQGYCEVIKTLLFSLQDVNFQLPFIGFDDLLPEEADNEDLGADELVEKVENGDITSLGRPAQIRFLVRNGPIVECFEIEAPSNRATQICEPVLTAMEKFKVPMAK